SRGVPPAIGSARRPRPWSRPPSPGRWRCRAMRVEPPPCQPRIVLLRRRRRGGMSSKIVLPPRAVIPHPPCWLRALRWRNGRSDGRAGLVCAVALSVGTRAICFKPDALTDDGRQVPNLDLPSSDREVVHDLHRRKLAHCSSSLAAGDGRKRDGGIARRAVGVARRRQL